MLSSLVMMVLLATSSQALPSLQHAHHHNNEKRADACPIKVASTHYLCDVKSNNTDTVRDLGFVGKVGGKVIYTYGDTLNGPGTSFWMTSGSSALGTNTACKIFDAALDPAPHPAQFVPWEEKWGETNTADSFGGTNVIATGADTGALFFLKNHRPIGGDDYMVGAGIANVHFDGVKPIATRPHEYWWSAKAGEPYYGDITAYGGKKYVWGLGHGGKGGAYAYLTRSEISNMHDLSKWQYYDGSTGKWSSKRLYHPSPAQALQWNKADGAVWGVGQGQIFYSNYYKKLMFVYALSWKVNGKTQVLARTADRPIGPWSEATVLYSVAPLKENGLIYAPIPNPHFDESGKTLIVTITNSPNTIQATKVTFA